jgi:hypothetical protein
MTVTVTTGLATEADSAFGSTTRGLSGQVYAATASDPGDSPFVYEDITVGADIYVQFDVRIDRYTLDSWNQGNREALLFALVDPDTDDTVVDLWVKRHLGRDVWKASTDLGGDIAYGTHLVAAGTHRVYVHASPGTATVALPLDFLTVNLA